MGNGSGKETEGKSNKPVFPAFLRIAVLGDTFVGKTCLCRTYESGRFQENTNLRIGASRHEQIFSVNNRKLTLFVFNISGHERFKEIWPFYLKNVEGILVLYDITSIRSFKSLPNWLETVKKTETTAPLFLVGARSDLNDQRKVTLQQGIRFAAERNLPFFECSAKSGENVRMIFEELAYTILERKNVVPPRHIERNILFKEGKQIENSTFSSTNTFAKSSSEINSSISNSFEEESHKAETVNASLPPVEKQVYDSINDSTTHSLEKEDTETNSQEQLSDSEMDENCMSSKSNRSCLSEEELMFIGKCC